MNIQSMNVAVQKLTFPGQKKTNLSKPMICCFPDGYIYEVFFHHGGSVNDATIMRGLMSQSVTFTEVFRPGDVFIFNPGYKDVVLEMRQKGFHEHTLASAAPGQQLTWH